MAVEIETPESLSDGDGVTASFPTGFTFTLDAEVRVFVRGDDGVAVPQELGVDFDLSAGDWPSNGADVVFKPGAIPAVGTKVGRRRVTRAAQEIGFGDQAAFRPGANEEAFDRLTRALQDERAKSNRALAVPIGEAGVELPPQAVRDGKLLAPVGDGLAVFDAPERAFVTDANGKLVQLPLVNVLQEIGIPFVDDGPWGEASDPLTHDDGAWNG